MAQTALTPIQLKVDNYAVVAGDLTLTFTASDTVNGNSFPATGKEILLVQNTDTVAHNFGIASVADPLGRTDASLSAYSVAASTIIAIQMSQLGGWVQSNGNVNLTSTSALLKFAVIRFL